MTLNTYLLGGHVSIAGGYKEALARAAALGGNALQMFSGSPRGWNLPKVTPAEAGVYRSEAKKLGIEACYFHASYLVNLADDGPNGKHSVDALIAELTVAEALGVRGSIIHLGSFKEGREKKNPSTAQTQVLLTEAVHLSHPKTNVQGLAKLHVFASHPLEKGESGIPPVYDHSTFLKEVADRPEDFTAYNKPLKYDLLISNIKEVLKKSPEHALFIIEDMGMRKIGRSLDEIANIIKDVDDKRVRVCLDTCHLHVAGYDLSSREKLDNFLADFDRNIGLDKLECFHINDSHDEFGSLRDRHENIGEGKVPKEVFKLLLNHPKTRHLPFILEVPGFDDNGPDKRNLDSLKGMIE